MSALGAGPHLDAEIRRVVFGEAATPYPGGAFVRVAPPEEWRRVPAYSSRIEAAWLVVTRLRAIGLGVVIGSASDGWEVEITTTEALEQQGYHGCSAPVGPLPLSICRAALHACSDASALDGSR
jgi:hypothetical protein